MLEAEFGVLITYRFDALVNENMLLSIAHLSFFNKELVVVDPQFLDQIGYLLLLSSIQERCLVCFWRVPFTRFRLVLVIIEFTCLSLSKETVFTFGMFTA